VLADFGPLDFNMLVDAQLSAQINMKLANAALLKRVLPPLPTHSQEQAHMLIMFPIRPLLAEKERQEAQ
jgi:hypothetical protein